MRFAAVWMMIGACTVAGCAAPLERQRPPLVPTGLLTEIHPPKPTQVLVQLTRIKNPVARPLRFSPDQRAEIYAALQPGDVLLTFTAGVSSNVVVPGKFKHALVYVGDELPGTENSLDAIEAAGEGVILTSLERAFDVRINRLAVLRPRLSAAQRHEYLVEVASYLGDKYDFAFDFSDPSRKSCTEVVYCALHGRNGIQFHLVNRAGRPTLIADDIVRQHLRYSTAETGFECILLADDDPLHPGQARLTFGPQSQQQLSALMRSTPPRLP